MQIHNTPVYSAIRSARCFFTFFVPSSGARPSSFLDFSKAPINYGNFVTSTRARPNGADIRVIQKYGFYWIPFYTVLLAYPRMKRSVTSPFEVIYIFISILWARIYTLYNRDGVRRLQTRCIKRM